MMKVDSINHQVERGSKYLIIDLIHERQATDRTEFIIRAGNMEEHCTQDIQRRSTYGYMTEVVQEHGGCRACSVRRSAI